MIDLDELRDSLRDDTALVSIMWANNETGTIFPIEEIAEIVHARGALFHTDAVQAVGKIPLDMSKLPIDFLALSGHKLHAPKGIGALYVRKGVPFRPFLLGGHQERGRRGGTEAVPSIIALGKACEIAQDHIEHENTVVKALRDRLEEGLVAAISDTRINGHATERLPNTLNISFKNIEGEGILLYMNEFGICASSGSACTSGSLEPSHVLRSMGVPYTFAHGSIRFSLSRFNTAEEIELVIKELPPIIKTLRAMSPYVDD
jgi:cysteine desulfurase